MGIISLKRSLDEVDRLEELHGLASAHLSAHEVLLRALGQAAGVMAGEAAGEFQQRLEQLQRRLSLDLAPAEVKASAADAGRHLDAFARARAYDNDRKAWECKQIVRIVAEATAAVTQTGSSQNAAMQQLAGRIDAVANLDDIALVRRELSARVGEIKALANLVEEQTQQRAAALEAKMRRAEERLQAARKLAETDALTGLGNRRMAEQAIIAAIAAGRRFCLILCDLDRFKAVNDTYGHQQGDLALQAAAAAVRRAVRPSDTVCRWGGDEFVILLWGAEAAIAERVGEAIQRPGFCRVRLREGVRQVWVAVGLSAGVAEYEPGEDAFDFFDRADKLMYDRKTARRTAPYVDARMGTFIANNRTGAPMTVELAGKAYAVAPGTFTLPLPAGSYTATVQSRCQKTFVAFQVSGGSVYTGDFSCQE